MIEYTGKYTTAKVMIDEIDSAAVAQIIQFVNHPVFTKPVSVMPDCHAGKGSVIGFTMEMADKIIPNIVGVDGSCGMVSVNLGLVKPFDRAKADNTTRAAIPFGFEVHGKKPLMNMERQFPWKLVTEENRRFVMAFNKKFNKHMMITEYNHKWFLDKCDEIGMDARRANNSLGTLGGGK
jgi:tRNA-splicing ligase RtcB